MAKKSVRHIKIREIISNENNIINFNDNYNLNNIVLNENNLEINPAQPIIDREASSEWFQEKRIITNKRLNEDISNHDQVNE